MLRVMREHHQRTGSSGQPDGGAGENHNRPTGAESAVTPKLHRALVEAGLVTDRPTIAPNANAAVPGKLLAAFEAASLADAEWMRLPSPRARCRLTGLSRTSLNELVDRGVVRAVTVRQPGAQRGIKLLNRASLLAYLARLDAEQNGTTAQEGGQQ